MKIAVFYHCLFCLKNEPLWSAVKVVHEQMKTLKESGLEDAAKEIHIGVNGSKESEVYAKQFLPSKAAITYHGLESRAENLTIVMLEQWLKEHDGWAVLYLHSKGATHDLESAYAQYAGSWRRTMMGHLVFNWRFCVKDLREGAEACGCNWLVGQGWDHSQNIFGGNFWWAKSGFLRTLPSIYERERIKTSGIGALESRYESEVWIGNGPRLPIVKIYHPGGM